jgi:hypothetical protein
MSQLQLKGSHSDNSHSLLPSFVPLKAATLETNNALEPDALQNSHRPPTLELLPIRVPLRLPCFAGKTRGAGPEALQD